MTMLLNQRLYDLFEGRAKGVDIQILCLGLGYTAVTLADKGIGLSYTHFEDKKSCMLLNSRFRIVGKNAPKIGPFLGSVSMISATCQIPDPQNT